jgi:hypothetical protein
MGIYQTFDGGTELAHEADQGAAIQSPFTCRTVTTSAPFANN